MNATPLNARRLSTLRATNFVLLRRDSPHANVVLWLFLLMFLPSALASEGAPVAKASVLPLDQLGATVEKQYSGDGLSVCATAGGARLRCVFQKMEGEVTCEGLWLTSTAEGSKGECFRVVATAMRRTADVAQSSRLRVNGASSPRSAPGDETSPKLAGEDACATSESMLPSLGSVEVAGHVARFIRPGLTEEYRVSVDGVQQDFVIAQRPGGHGPLRVDLDVTGAKAEPLVNGARLVLEGSGRKLNYNRLRVTDATGKELPARMEMQSSEDGQVYQYPAKSSSPATISRSADFQSVSPICNRLGFRHSGTSNLRPAAEYNSAKRQIENLRYFGCGSAALGCLAGFQTRAPFEFARAADWEIGLPAEAWAQAGDTAGLETRATSEPAPLRSATTLALLVDDTEAVYPVRIDPTFSDADWFSLGGIPGPDRPVYACVVDDSGNLYIGGQFTVVGEVVANYIAKWNGSAWSALGSGMSGDVYALAVSGSDLYAGGGFTTAGGKVSGYAARANIGGGVAPVLSIFRSGAKVTLSWPSVGAAGFLLEQTSTVANPASWTPSSVPVTDNTTTKSVSIPITNSQQFFRLRKP